MKRKYLLNLQDRILLENSTKGYEKEYTTLEDIVNVIPTKDFALEVAIGNVSKTFKINKFGCGPDCDSGIATDVWDGADGATSTDIWVAPTQARVHDIVSTQAADDGSPVGTGMRTVRILNRIH